MNLRKSRIIFRICTEQATRQNRSGGLVNYKCCCILVAISLSNFNLLDCFAQMDGCLSLF